MLGENKKYLKKGKSILRKDGTHRIISLTRTERTESKSENKIAKKEGRKEGRKDQKSESRPPPNTDRTLY